MTELQGLPSIRSVLAAYRSTEARITEDQITAAWTEHERALRLIEAQARLIRLLDTGPLHELADQVALARRDIDGLERSR